MRITSTVLVAGIALTLVVSACGGSSSPPQPTTSPAPISPAPTTAAPTTAAPISAAPISAAPTTAAPTTVAPTTTPPAAVDPNAPELVEPGDIPDNQVFVAFPSPDGTFSVKVPEGWARTEVGGVVTFTDNYNSVTIQSSPAASAPTPQSIQAGGFADVSADPTFTALDVQPVTRKAGAGVLAKYEIGSAPNPVTGKKALLAVERYVFFHNGTAVTLTLSGAKGADNVDPWKIVSNSLAWT